MPISETAIQPIVRQEQDTRLEPRYRILIMMMTSRPMTT